MPSQTSNEYTTPLVLRYGFLIDWKRTLSFAYTWMILTMILFCLSGVSIWVLVSDIWIWSWIFVWAAVVWVAKSFVEGFENFFDIFDGKTKGKLKLYKSFDINKDKPKELTPNQELIKSIFTKKGYDSFKSDVRNLLFHRWHKKGLIPVGVVSLGLVVFTYLFIWPYGEAAYGFRTWPFYEILTILGASSLFISFLFAGSFAGVILSFLIATNRMKDQYLKISKYVNKLRNEKEIKSEEMIGYPSFKNKLSAIGQFLFSMTSKILGLFVSYILYWAYRTWLLGDPLIPERVLIGVAFSLIAAILTYASQIGLHDLLSRYKEEILTILMDKQASKHCELVNMLSGKNEPSLESFKAYDHFEKIVTDLENSSTWAFPVNTITVALMSLLPLITSILSLVIENFLL